MTVTEKIQAKVAADKGAIPPITQFEMLADPEMLAKIEEKERLDRAAKYVEMRQTQLKADIESALIAEGVDAVSYKGWAIKQGKGRTGDKISATKLVELGVPIATVAAATVEGRAYTFAQVVVPKDAAHPITTWAELEAALPAEAFA